MDDILTVIALLIAAFAGGFAISQRKRPLHTSTEAESQHAQISADAEDATTTAAKQEEIANARHENDSNADVIERFNDVFSTDPPKSGSNE